MYVVSKILNGFRPKPFVSLAFTSYFRILPENWKKSRVSDHINLTAVIVVVELVVKFIAA
jgi:hypothetical protein